MKFAFVFPGQGSQAVGMLNAWGDNAEVKRTLDEASEALGEDVAKLIAEGPAEALSLTTNTQPVMLTAGVACYRAWIAAGGPTASVMAGHSLGEYGALVASGVRQHTTSYLQMDIIMLQVALRWEILIKKSKKARP